MERITQHYCLLLPSDGELYSGTAYNFLGSEPIISRYSPSHSLLRTEYSTSWLNGEFILIDVRQVFIWKKGKKANQEVF